MGNGPLRKTRAVTERRRQQGRQSTPSTTLDGAVTGPSTDAPAVTEGSQKQGRQFTDAIAVKERSQKQGRQSTPKSTLDGPVAGPSTDTVAVTEVSQQQGRQSTPTSTLDGAVAGSFTYALAVTEGREKQGRQSTDALAVTEGSQKQGRKSIPMSTLDGAVSGPSTDAQAVIEVSQQQGRQSTPTSTLDGAVAGSFTDALAVTEGREQQGRRSTSTTTHNYIGCSVSQYDLSNTSYTSVGNHGHRGCASHESLRIRIKQLNEVFKETHTLHKAEELLKRHKHMAIIGAPGEGKTSTALKICEKYLHKKYEVVFVDNFEIFDVDTIIQRTCNMLVVFDDIFGSVTVPSNWEKIHKVSTALVDALFQQEHDAMKQKSNKQEETQAGEIQNNALKLHFIFSSRSYNWNEGRGRMHQFKVNLFKPESVIDMTKTGLTTKEKESILNSFEKRSKKCDISNQNKNTITQLQDSRFGFPLICQLYCTNPAFQMHNIIDFFQKPVTYLRGDLDAIVREGSSRSATLILLVLCGGKLDLVSFKAKEKNLTNLFQAVKEEIASCTQTDIGKDIRNFTGTYCRVENHVASFSHPSIYDAAACALGNLNEVFVLEHCSLQFLLEKVRLNKNGDLQTSYTDNVTNMIYITSSLHPLVISRLVEGVREGCFRWTVGHPVFSCVQIVSDFLTQMTPDLPDVVHRKDKSSGECFLYWVSLSTNHSLFERSVSLMCREGSLSHSVLADFYESIIGCTQHGNLRHLKHIAVVLKQQGEYDVDRRTNGERTLLMIAAEAGQLGVFNFLLQEGADVSVTDEDHYNCLHLSCKSGSKDIVNVIIEKFQHLVNGRDRKGNTPAMLCAKSGQVELLKCFVLHKADLTIRNDNKINTFDIACINGHVSVVEYLLTCEHMSIHRRDRWWKLTKGMQAAVSGHYDVYTLLVSGDDLSLTEKYNSDLLMSVFYGGDASIVKHVLSLKTFDINRRESLRKQTAVMMAAERGHNDVYNLLVLEGADLSLTDKNKNDCLMLACYGGYVSIVKHLLSLKTFDINRRAGRSKQTSVMVAAEGGHTDVYNLLVLEGADLSLTDENDRDCLMFASETGNVSIVKHLLSLKLLDINRRAGQSKQTAVMMAAKRGHYDVYNLLVLEGADLSLTDDDDNDCLMLACRGGNVSIVKHLLSLKTFDINRRDRLWKQTAVMMAAERGHNDVYNLLVLEGADLSLTDRGDKNCLMLTCEGGNVSIVKHLLSLKTFDINRPSGSGKQRAVMMAVERGHNDVYNLLVLEGADLSLTDGDNMDCLMLACFGNKVSVVKQLLSLKTFDINRRNGSRKQTAVMMAASRGQYDVYILFVLEGADLSLTDDDDRDCLMLACTGGNMAIVKHLLSLKTFDINRRGVWWKQTAVMMASKRGHYDVYNLLVLEGADLSLADKNNMDCLMLACHGGSVSIVKHLLSLKLLDINRRGGWLKETAVMIAVKGGNYDVYNLLVLEGADLSLTDEYNNDCLMWACERRHVYIVKHLLSFKTLDINRRDRSRKQTAVMIAAERGHNDVYNLLVLEGAVMSLADKNNNDCLMLACYGGYVSIVKHLLSLKTFDINRRNRSRKQTAVMMAAERGHNDVYDLLVLEGADLSLTDKNNNDCLMLACYGGYVSIVKHLLSLKTFVINRRERSLKRTTVMIAAERGHYDVYNLLVLEGAVMSLTDKNNNDCLMLACYGGYVSIVKHLLSLKTFDINRRNRSRKQTAVMIAAEKGHYDVYDLLVLEGADLSLTDKNNNDCLMLACKGRHVYIVKHLLSLKTLDINRRERSCKQTAVMMAVEGGHYDVYNLLVLEGAVLSLTDKYNNDCLMLACFGGNMAIVKHLLSLETFDINRQDRSKIQTAVMIAAERGHYDVCNLLVLEGADLSLTDEDNNECGHVREAACP